LIQILVTMQLIKDYLKKLAPISEEETDFFFSMMEKKVFKKESLILTAGKVENHIYFIESGIVRFWIDKDEKEISSAFVFEGSFFSSYPSFLTRKASIWNIQAITPTVLWSISYSNLQQIYKQISVGEKIGRLVAEHLAIMLFYRETSLLRETPEERYLMLFSEHPRFLQSIPLKYLASYIGVTPQALSRIRKRIS